MIARHTFHDLLWIELESPTHDDVRGLMEEFDIHPIVADELLSPSTQPKVDHYENFVYLVLHFPALRHSHEHALQEVDFIISKKFLITVRYETIDPLHKFSKVFEVNSILDKSDFGDHAGFLFYYMIRKLYASLLHEVAAMGDGLLRAEERIFSGEERKMVEEISRLSRNILLFHRALRLHGPTLHSMKIATEEFFGPDFRHHAESIVDEYRKVEEALEHQKEMLHDLRETNTSLLTTKTNESIKALTTLNALILPGSFIAWIFAVDAADMPIRGMIGDFWFILGIMIFVSIANFSYLRYRKWI